MEGSIGVRGIELSPMELVQIASELNKVGFNVSVKVSDRGASVLTITKRKPVIEIYRSH